MSSNDSTGRPCSRGRRMAAAFSLIEIIVVVGLLSLITLGLFAMFSQTQRVFRMGLTQVDVLEGGRIVTEMLTRDVQQMRASYRPWPGGVNFYAELAPQTSVHPLLQTLPGLPATKRTNLLEDVYFLTRENQTWTGIGYVVRPITNGVGTLYRFMGSSSAAQTPDTLFNRFYATPVGSTNMSRVLDGVVHFKVRAYNPAGQWITSPINSGPTANSDVLYSSFAFGEIGRYNFWSNALPASVEIEIGILENRALRRAESIQDDATRRRYLEDQAGKVHIFRLRVPVRNADSAAYS